MTVNGRCTTHGPRRLFCQTFGLLVVREHRVRVSHALNLNCWIIRVVDTGHCKRSFTQT